MWSNPLKSGEDLYQYIPQRPPFVMIDKLYEKGKDFAVSGLLVSPDNILVENGMLQEGGLVENIAQTAALFAGINVVELGREMPLGYIAGIKNLVINQLPAVSEEIYTRINLTNDLMNIQIVEGEVLNREGTVLAACELRIFIKETE